MDYTALKNEITENPKAIPDLNWSQTDEWIRDALNTIGISSETIVRESINTADIITAIYSDASEFDSLTDSEVAKLNLLSPVGTIDPSDLQAVFLDMFPTPARENIRAALIALATRSASRSEKIPNVEQQISLEDVHMARRS